MLLRIFWLRTLIIISFNIILFGSVALEEKAVGGMCRVIQDVEAGVAVISLILFIALANIFVHYDPGLLRFFEAASSIRSFMHRFFGLLVLKLNRFDCSFLGGLVIEVSLRYRLLLLNSFLLEHGIVI